MRTRLGPDAGDPPTVTRQRPRGGARSRTDTVVPPSELELMLSRPPWAFAIRAHVASPSRILAGRRRDANGPAAR